MTPVDPRSTDLPEIVQEAVRIVDRAEETDVPLRLLGGIAIHLRSGEVPAELNRGYADIDLVTNRKNRRQAMQLLQSLGYAPNERVNMMGDGSRLQAVHPEAGGQVDVFVGAFHMCHTVPIEDRLTLEPRTLPLAELLLTKLQVVQLNVKDITDVAMLLDTHEVGDGDGSVINARHIADLLADDWGLWRTVQGAVHAVPAQMRSLGLTGDLCDRVERRLDEVWTLADDAPKTRRWRMRARIGERRRWYDEPEEVQR
jgi:hypothetical protein